MRAIPGRAGAGAPRMRAIPGSGEGTGARVVSAKAPRPVHMTQTEMRFQTGRGPPSPKEQPRPVEEIDWTGLMRMPSSLPSTPNLR